MLTNIEYTPELFCNTAVLVIMSVATVLQLLRDLRMLQQNSYRTERYWRWMKETNDTMDFCFWAVMLMLFLDLSSLPATLLKMSITALLGIYVIVRLCRIKYKKLLAMTRRAWRIFITDLIICLIVGGAYLAVFRFGYGCSIPFTAACIATALFLVTRLTTIASVWVLTPVEYLINRKYYRRAAARLAQMPDLKIIGITGSYGKTSTKHYLHRILSQHYDTLMTPGSYNTTLGVIRTINEYLKPYNQVFIVEMGAKQKGDIKEICDLVHPQAGIITAVGPQHLETFKSIESVRDTKFELADAIPADGLVVINNDFEPAKHRPVSNTIAIRYGIADTENCAYTAINITYGPDGTDFTITGPDGFALDIHTRLVGECNISNLIAAVIVALHLGIPESKIQYAIQTIEQVEHRLQMRHLAGGITIIDDAFNSNPSGSRMALQVLGGMTTGSRFVITPGMIELGEMQFDLNKEFGKNIAKNADFVFVVGEYNQEAILTGLMEAGYPEDKVVCVDTFLNANAQVMTMAKPGDTILIENDLPDTFK